eukprot:g4156.t1
MSKREAEALTDKDSAKYMRSPDLSTSALPGSTASIRGTSSTSSSLPAEPRSQPLAAAATRSDSSRSIVTYTWKVDTDLELGDGSGPGFSVIGGAPSSSEGRRGKGGGGGGGGKEDRGPPKDRVSDLQSSGAEADGDDFRHRSGEFEPIPKVVEEQEAKRGGGAGGAGRAAGSSGRGGGGSSALYALARGGSVIRTSAGLIQVGIPPETIKDSLNMGAEVPTNFVIAGDLFDRFHGLSVAEFEFPSYFNFFVKGRKVNIITTADLEQRVRHCMQETLLGPSSFDIKEDYAEHITPDAYPDFPREALVLDAKKPKTIDTLIKFTLFDPETNTCSLDENVKISRQLQTGRAHHRTADYTVTIHDAEQDLKVQVPANCMITKRSLKNQLFEPFDIPIFGVTMLGCSHGFDPKETTTGFVLWINRRGLMCDPPNDSSDILEHMGIPASSIEGIILTHCHADHDAGTFQKILLSTKIKIFTTKTIIESFLRKYSSLTGFAVDFLRRLFDFQQLTVGNAFEFAGGKIFPHYALHVIPCIGFKIECHGKTLCYSGDTHTNPALLQRMREEQAVVPPIHTPIEVLEELPDDVKERMFVVHCSKDAIPKSSTLKRAREWSTVRIHVNRTDEDKRHEIYTLLRPIWWLRSVSDAALRQIVLDCKATLTQHKKGRSIQHKGDTCQHVNVVAAGVISVPSSVSSLTSTATTLEQKIVCGDSFGQECLVNEAHRYPSDLRSRTRLFLVTFNRAEFLASLAKNESLDRVVEDIEELMAQHRSPAWNIIKRSRLAFIVPGSIAVGELIAHFQHKEYLDSDLITSAGKAQGCWLISSGRLRVSIYDPPKLTGDEVARASYLKKCNICDEVIVGPGRIVGHFDAILQDQPAWLSLNCESDVQCYFISRKEFKEFAERYPGVIFKLFGKYYL